MSEKSVVKQVVAGFKIFKHFRILILSLIYKIENANDDDGIFVLDFYLSKEFLFI